MEGNCGISEKRQVKAMVGISWSKNCLRKNKNFVTFRFTNKASDTVLGSCCEKIDEMRKLRYVATAIVF